MKPRSRQLSGDSLKPDVHHAVHSAQTLRVSGRELSPHDVDAVSYLDLHPSSLVHTKSLNTHKTHTSNIYF